MPGGRAMDRASRLGAAELLHDAFYRRPVWTSTSKLGMLHAIEQMLLRGQRRVDGVEPPRHRADAVAGGVLSRRRRVGGVSNLL